MSAPDPRTRGSKMNGCLNTRIRTEKYAHSLYNTVKRFVGEIYRLRESPEEGTSDSAEGHVEEATGQVMFEWILKDV